MVPWGAVDQEKFRKMWEAGLKTKKLAEIFRTPERTVKHWLHMQGMLRFSRMPDADLDAWVARARSEAHVRAGTAAVKGWIKGNGGHRVSAHRVRASMARLVPPDHRQENELRDLRAYANRGPYAVLHSDGNHKASTPSSTAKVFTTLSCF